MHSVTSKDSPSSAKSLENLKPAAGSHRSRKRLGRGIGSGLGKTAGRGHKGQRARKSGNVRPGFEGGQMKLYMRLPKRGFNNRFRKEFNEVNLESLSGLAPGTVVDVQLLSKLGLLRWSNLPVKLLGRGSLSVKLNVQVNHATVSARAAVEKAGGSLTIVGVNA